MIIASNVDIIYRSRNKTEREIMNDEFAMDYYQLDDDSLEWHMISEDKFLDNWFEEKMEEANMELQEIVNV